MDDPDWSRLPQELLLTISEKLVTSVLDYADHIRFRAVCHQWRSALPPRPLHLPLQIPWLMIPSSRNDDDSTIFFYDLAASQFLCLDRPEILGFQICGSSHGWFILCKNLQMSLFNPITRAVITLPEFSGRPSHLGFPPPDVPDAERFFRTWDSDRYVMEPTTHLSVYKAILTSSPLNPDCLVFVHTGKLWLLSFCKIGDDHWTVIEFVHRAPLQFDYISDFTYSNGCLYTINGYGAVTMYNLNTPSRVMLKCSVEFEGFVDLVDGSSSEIFLVGHAIEVHESEMRHIVYKFSNGEEPKWIEVNDIGQNVLFVGAVQNAIVLPSANLQLPGWGANCLCYEYSEKQRQGPGRVHHSIKMSRLHDGKITADTGHLGSFHNNKNLRKSLWLIPGFN